MTAAKADRVLELREAFDRSFAETARVGALAQQDFLAIRIAGDPFALRLSEVASLHVDSKLVAAPSLLPELLGIAGFRATLTPVYDLGALLGYRVERSAKWLIIARSPAPIGFAFAAFEAHLRVPVSQVSLAEVAAQHVRGAVAREGTSLPLLHLPSLVEGIAQRIKASGPSQDR